MLGVTKQSNKNRIPKFKQFVTYKGIVINLLTVGCFRYFYSDHADKWYLGYHSNMNTWTTIDSSIDEDMIIEKFKALQKELLK